MSLQMWALTEFLPALITPIALLSQVNSLMNTKCRAIKEAFPTLVTCVRLLSWFYLLKITVGGIIEEFFTLFPSEVFCPVWVIDSAGPTRLGESHSVWNWELLTRESWHQVKSFAICCQICWQESSSCGFALGIVSIFCWTLSPKRQRMQRCGQRKTLFSVLKI